VVFVHIDTNENSVDFSNDDSDEYVTLVYNTDIQVDVAFQPYSFFLFVHSQSLDSTVFEIESSHVVVVLVVLWVCN